jgi:hypothetical protein
MRVRGYYGTIYEIPEDTDAGLSAIDESLWSIRKNFPKIIGHPDINTLLDLRNDILKAQHDDSSVHQ